MRNHLFSRTPRGETGIAANRLTKKECFGRGQSDRFACLTFAAPIGADIQMLK
jgi:hypothetical protein